MSGVRDVVVVGGGVAGLSAARECARVGLSVTVLEAGRDLGGALASHEVAGLTLDSGAESFAVRRNAVAEFIEGLGLADRVVQPNAAGAWLCLPSDRPGGPAVSVPMPRAGVLGIPGSPLAEDVRRVIGWPGALRAWLDRLMPVLTIGREHSLGELVRKRMGRRVLERLVEPVTAGVYTSSADDLEVDVVAPGLNAALTVTGSLSGAVLSLRSAAPAGSAVSGLRGGMAGLVTALRAELDRFDVEVFTEAAVTSIRPVTAGPWQVTIAPRPEASEESDAPESPESPDTPEATAAPGGANPATCQRPCRRPCRRGSSSSRRPAPRPSPSSRRSDLSRRRSAPCTGRNRPRSNSPPSCSPPLSSTRIRAAPGPSSPPAHPASPQRH
ncbi:protoporphyrinogen/coproporphyrinogen oxidase [Cryobacterium sp. 10C3]|uniref:protoporphyrinogen/coproporphyrinogen oxidase n=1 Tax=Cryobacterium sp. 10C3 TaxID=3048577 RepID=UPI002AB3C940|nr:FAD-dependent oxidoreductase [Cryobacterium sp. 10C3]MDY7558303.1 FAD-dependent oxidoreductase [Cryobacterium sp. 10C3]